MPCLRQVLCQIEWPETGLKFEEYGTVYGDGIVETFIAVPNTPQPFCIHLTSKGYIAEGLALLVYIDGEYQCNRNRLHLKPPKKGQPRAQTEVDFRLRQKEKTIGGGAFIGRDWRFDCHNIVPNGQFLHGFDPKHFDQLGVIEVIVLRCRAKVGDDDGSESLTHESILSDIDNFGQPFEESTAPAENRQPTVADAPDEAEELTGLAGFSFDGAADGANHVKGDRAADLPFSVGLDGEASPTGYWTYHPEPPPRNGHRPERRPERRVHFDYGSPREPYSSVRAPPQRRHGPPRGSCHGETDCNAPSNWQDRDPVGYEARADWNTPQSSSTFRPKINSNWSTPCDASRGAPRGAPGTYCDLNPNGYEDYDPPQPYILPLNPRPAPVPRTATSFLGPNIGGPEHSSWIPAPPISVGYPVFTPHLQFPSNASYSAPLMHPPWYPPPYPFHGPGCAMNYPVPVEGWHGNQGRGPSGSLDHAEEENAQRNENGNQAGNNTWGAPVDSGKTDGNVENDNAKAGGWGGSDNNTTNQPAGGDMANNWDQRPEENQQDQNGDNNGALDNNADDNTTNSQHQQTDQGQGDNSQNNDQQWQDNSGGWGNESGQSNQTEGNWDNNGQNPQPQGNLGSDPIHNPGTAQPQQPAQNWPSQPTPPQASRTMRPLYGPYGAYYSTHLHAATALSPTAEAEEEPPFDVPEMIAMDRGTTHQVQPGKGYLYVHRRASPEYLDAIEEPYARFVFKYRTKEQIERELGIVIKCEPTGDEEKRKFTDKTQDELIELLVRAQNALGGKIPSPPPPPPAGDDGAKQDKLFNHAQVPAPTTYKYLKYELPKARNAGLGISSGGGDPQATAQQQGGGPEEWPRCLPGLSGGWVAPPDQQQQQQQQSQQGAPNWQTAGESCTHNQGVGAWENNNANATNQSSPAEGGWNSASSGGVLVAGGGLQEAPAPSGGRW